MSIPGPPLPRDGFWGHYCRALSEAARQFVTRICHRVADFAVTHNATSDVVR
jgi:hypothetical protein